MILEFEAESKAAAERKASQSGMSVNRVENVSDGYVAHADEPSGRARRSKGEGSFGLLLRFLFLVGVVAALFWWFYWRKHGHLPGM
jgi:hypothetical protein